MIEHASKLPRPSITAAMVATTLLLLLTVPTITAQAVEAGERGGLSNATVMKAKAIALRYTLDNSLRLNLDLSEQLRGRIASLLSVNISELSSDELHAFVQNAVEVLAEVRERARNAVGKTFESYANGLVVAIEARVRSLARHYNISEEVRLAPTSLAQSKDLREVFKALESVQEGLLEGQCNEFANALRKCLGDQVVQALSTGEIRGLETSYKALDKSVEALSATLERLEAVNASLTALQAVARALENVQVAKEIVGKLKEEALKSGLSPADIIRKSLNETLEKLVSKAEGAVDRLTCGLELIQSLAEKINATDIVEKVEGLRAEPLKVEPVVPARKTERS